MAEIDDRLRDVEGRLTALEKEVFGLTRAVSQLAALSADSLHVIANRLGDLREES